jgi:L-ribulose-5-phosphate 3-epimerase UlaE
MINSNQVTRRGFLGRSLATGAVGVATTQLAIGLAVAKATPDNPWRVGIFTRPWHKHDYRESIELVGKKNFHLWYDPGNIYYYSDGKLDPVDDAATVDSLVTGMCVKDYRHPKNVDVTPGTGQVNFSGVMDRLKKGGFAGGSLIIEALKPGDLARTLREARQARRFVEELIGQNA